MKGTFFQRPVEFNLLIDGESWNQEDEIKGTLVVKNHGNEPLSLSDVHVDLGYADLRHVRQKNPNAFELISSVPFGGPATVEPRGEASMPWKFQTTRNSPITEKSASLFLLYGRGTDTTQLGQLQILVNPHWVIQQFLDTFKTQFRFVVKSQKTSKGQVEVKLAYPDSKSFATLDHIAAYFRFDEDTLEVRYVFHIKKVEGAATGFDVKKDKKELSQKLAKNDYLVPSGRINHERLEALIREALGAVEKKILY